MGRVTEAKIKDVRAGGNGNISNRGMFPAQGARCGDVPLHPGLTPSGMPPMPSDPPSASSVKIYLVTKKEKEQSGALE